jgi:hypothetical protein
MQAETVQQTTRSSANLTKQKSTEYGQLKRPLGEPHQVGILEGRPADVAWSVSYFRRVRFGLGALLRWQKKRGILRSVKDPQHGQFDLWEIAV